MSGKKQGFSREDKIIFIIVCFVLSFAVIFTAGMVVHKRSVPENTAVEVIALSDETFSRTDEGLWEDDDVALTVTEAIFPVNINTADKRTLMKLDGIGEATAEAIIEYREKDPFEKIEDIMNVKGIGEKKFEAIKDDICV